MQVTETIAARFSDKALHYDACASLQFQIAEQFFRWLDAKSDEVDFKPKTILELGCGTGFLTQHLLGGYPDSALHACDLATSMLAQCRLRTQERVQLHQADAASFTLAQRVDWTISSFCLQWVEDLPHALQLHASNSKRLSFCVPCSNSFSDWIAAHQHAGFVPALWSLPNADDILKTLQCIQVATGARLRHRREFWEEHHESPLAFARHLRAIGADTGKPTVLPDSITRPATRHATGESGDTPTPVTTATGLRQAMRALPSPYIARYDVLMVDLIIHPSASTSGPPCVS